MYFFWREVNVPSDYYSNDNCTEEYSRWYKSTKFLLPKVTLSEHSSYSAKKLSNHKQTFETVKSRIFEYRASEASFH